MPKELRTPGLQLLYSVTDSVIPAARRHFTQLSANEDQTG